MQLALNVICKDEYRDVIRIIKDYGKYFDELCFAVDDKKVLEQLKFEYGNKAKFFEFTWCDDFSAKRNFLASKTESPYYFRLDCDDEIEHPENIKPLFDKMVENNFNLVYVPYIYSKDKDGNCIAEHWRETIILKRQDIYWKKPIHENILIDDETLVRGIKADSVRIIHNLTEEHARASTERNLKLLLKEFDRDKEKTDPRTVAYIGRVYMGLGYWKEAIPFLELLIAKSGWDDDKYFAWVHLAECHKSLRNLDIAIGACNEALEMNTKFPDAYICKGSIYLMKEDYEKALDWLMYGLVRQKPDTMFVIDPSVYGWRVRLYIAMAYLGKGEYENAIKWLAEAKALSPTNQDILSKEGVFIDAYKLNQYTQNLLALLQQTDDKQALVETIPKRFLTDERIYGIKNKFGKPHYWSRKSVAIWCGSSWEDWTPPNVLNGIGGSEEAVIYLSKELVKLGWEVTVFNQCGENAGTYDGVVYRNYYEFNPLDTFHIVIGWRTDIFKLTNVRCRKKIVWLHDIPNKKDYLTAKTHLDKVVVLSQFHKSLLPKELPDRCIYVSSNGINLEDFKPTLLTRNPHRMIFTSSYDRGIEHLLVMWKDIKEAIPDAELHLFYGWDTYDKMMKAGRRPVKYRQIMTALMKQDGVFEHGRIGHKQLIKEFYKSGVWVYPSHFEEISCISGIKAQACGCVPVCTDYAALEETVRGGVKVTGKCGEGDTNERFKEALIKVLKDTDYQEKLRSELPDKEVFSWGKVAKKWIEELFILENLKYESMKDYEEVYATYGDWNPQPLEKGWEFSRFTWAIDFVGKHPEFKTGLDVGSFDGCLPVLLSDKYKGRFVCDAQDIKSVEFNYARKVIAKESLSTEIFTGCSIERLETEKKYDIVFCMEMLEHTLEPQVVLKKIHSLLNDGGFLMVTVPDKDGGFGRERDELFNGTHLRDYTEETLREELAKHFTVVEMFKKEDLIQAIVKK
jgi:glycosyltransferase involved in cell wall biosynthesis/2-polyprenyl-3-methyl-5-hydroxy-6-metoxy-1,4-benzoquinol methylase